MARGRHEPVPLLEGRFTLQITPDSITILPIQPPYYQIMSSYFARCMVTYNAPEAHYCIMVLVKGKHPTESVRDAELKLEQLAGAVVRDYRDHFRPVREV